MVGSQQACEKGDGAEACLMVGGRKSGGWPGGLFVSTIISPISTENSVWQKLIGDNQCTKSVGLDSPRWLKQSKSNR